MQTTYSRRTLQQSNFLCKLSENIFPTTSSAGHFIAEAPDSAETIRREMGERERRGSWGARASERDLVALFHPAAQPSADFKC